MTDKIPVSVIVLTLNEERNIVNCLESLSPFAEVFVVDSNSVDRTCEIARDMGAVPVNFTWNRQYPRKKQWSLDNLPFSYDWVLYVDADERVSDALAEEIRALFAGAAPGHDGYFIGFDYRFAGRILRYGQRIWKLALMRRDKAYFSPRDDLEVTQVGDLEMHYQPTLKGTTAILRSRMIHDNEESLHHFFARHNNYSNWEAVVRHNGSYFGIGDAQPFMRRWLKPLFARLPAKPLIAFCYSYFLRAGFLDGRAGFDFAVARAVHFWQIDLKIRERVRQHGPPAD